MIEFNSDLTSNFISGLALVISSILAVFYIMDRRRSKFIFEDDYSNQIMAWYSEVIEVLMLIKLNLKFRSGNNSNDLAKLSSLIERGRFFFPNFDKGDSYGRDKPDAYRGYRNLALDFLVALYNLYNNPTRPGKDIGNANILSQNFTSIIFEILRPKEKLDTIRSITNKYFIKNKSYEDFFENNDPDILKYLQK